MYTLTHEVPLTWGSDLVSWLPKRMNSRLRSPTTTCQVRLSISIASQGYQFSKFLLNQIQPWVDSLSCIKSKEAEPKQNTTNQPVCSDQCQRPHYDLEWILSEFHFHGDPSDYWWGPSGLMWTSGDSRSPLWDPASNSSETYLYSQRWTPETNSHNFFFVSRHFGVPPPTLRHSVSIKWCLQVWTNTVLL